jgi:hypothetical protein
MKNSIFTIVRLGFPILCVFAMVQATPSRAQESHPVRLAPNFEELNTAVKLFQMGEDPESMSRYVRELRTQETDLSFCGSLAAAINSNTLSQIYSNDAIGRAADALYYAIKIDIALKRLGIPIDVYEAGLDQFRELARTLLLSKDMSFSKHLATSLNSEQIIGDRTDEAPLSYEDKLEISHLHSIQAKVNARFTEILDSITRDVNAYASKKGLGFRLPIGNCGGGPPWFSLTVELQPPRQAKFYYINALQWRLCGVRGTNPWDRERCDGWWLGSARENSLPYGQYYLLGIWAETSLIAKEKIMLQGDTRIKLLPESKAISKP